MSNIISCNNMDDLAARAAHDIGQIVEQAVAERGKCSFALAGGHTPAPVYRRLGEDGAAGQAFWQDVYFLWGDERCVPPDDRDSNYRMAEENLFRYLQVPGENVYRMPGELSPATAARQYEDSLKKLLLPDRDYSRKLWPVPQLDVVLLGLGEDGHTASLFPETAALQITDRWVVENYVPQKKSWRLTLTLPILKAARQVIFLVSGADKQEAVREVLHGDYSPENYPAQAVARHAKEVTWYIEDAALPKSNE